MQTKHELSIAPAGHEPLPRLAPGVSLEPHHSNGNGVSKSMSEPKANILLVDDRPDKMLALEAVLSTLGQNIVQARSGKEALRHLLKQDFAVILLDVSMPGMDGFETAALIRTREHCEHIPIIFVTSIGNTENNIAKGYSLGAVDYLLTPIVPDVLRSKVAVFVELHRQTAIIKQQAEQLRQIEQNRHQRELAAVVNRLEIETKRNRFFTLALDLLGIADLDGRLLQLNPSWERSLGYSEVELKAISGRELVHPEDAEKLAAGLKALKAGRALDYFEGRFRHKDGSYRWLGGTAVPFLAEELIYIFVRDITARKNAEEQVIRLNQELEQRVDALIEANRELEAFSYSISHDLRAPLRSMGSFSQALLDQETPNLSPMGADFARRIHRSAKYMDTLLTDLLAYGRMAQTEVPPECVCLEDPLHEVLLMVETEIRDRGVRVEIQTPLDKVYAHLPTVKQIMANLIGNSLKFVAPDRCLHLRIRTETHACQPTSQGRGGPQDARDFVRLWIEDNGIGIAPEHHEKIFGLFHRLHDGSSYPGTGIGLALVRKGAERMGGRVGVESELGVGSRFWVDFPTRSEVHGE